MKVTVVIEFNVPDDTPTSGVEGIVSDCLSDRLPAEFGFRIMEAIAAPYGPNGRKYGYLQMRIIPKPSLPNGI